MTPHPPLPEQIGALTATRVTTTRLTLEPLTLEHAAPMVSVLSDPALYTHTGGHPPTLAELEQRYARQLIGHSPDNSELWLNWIVTLTASNEPVGFIQATIRIEEVPDAAPDPDALAAPLTGELAWVIGTHFQRVGFASEAASAALNAMSNAGVERFIAHIHPAHHGSEHVATRLSLRPTTTFVDGERRWHRDLRQR